MDDHKLDSVLEARPLAGNTRLLIVDVVVGFAVSELTEVNILGHNPGFGDFTTDFGLHPDSVYDDVPFCFWESRGERILLSVIIGASSDAPDI